MIDRAHDGEPVYARFLDRSRCLREDSNKGERNTTARREGGRLVISTRDAHGDFRPAMLSREDAVALRAAIDEFLADDSPAVPTMPDPLRARGMGNTGTGNARPFG